MESRVQPIHPVNAILGGALLPIGLGLLGGSLGGGSGRSPSHPAANQMSLNLTNALNNPTGLNQGMTTLNQILSSQGRINPIGRNRVLTNVGRQTEAQQLQQSQGAAQRGLQNSGVLQAINAAIGAAGADRMAAVDADFTLQEEQRKRDDLGLLLSLLINPALQQTATAAGVASNISSNNMAQRGATIGALAQLLSGLSSR